MIDYSDLIGVPFKNKGRDPKTGLDCYGLVQEVFKRYGITIPEYWAAWDDVEKISSIIAGEKEKTCWKRLDIPKEPSLMTIRFGVPKPFVNHTGVYIGNGRFIHIRENTGVCVDSIDSPAWRHVIDGYYTYIGENNG